MKKKKAKLSKTERIDHEAAEWVARKVGGLSAREQDAFFDWLAADPQHGEWFRRHMKTWKQLDLLAQWLPEHSKQASQDLLKDHYVRYYWRWFGGIAAVLLLGCLLFAVIDLPNTSNVSSSNLVANVYKRHVLEDNSIVELNQGAALKIDYTETYRLVELVSNEAHFTVSRDSRRPFIVRVRGIDIRAIGTAFNVRLTDQSVQVIVTEGKVEVVSKPEQSVYEKSINGNNVWSRHEVLVGQMTEIPLKKSLGSPYPGAREVKAVSLAEMNHLLAWKPQMFEFDSTPLEQIVEEFNRRNQTHLVIGDSKLARMPVVASFRSANVEHFLELLQLSMDLEIHRQGDDTIVLYLSH